MVRVQSTMTTRSPRSTSAAAVTAIELMTQNPIARCADRVMPWRAHGEERGVTLTALETFNCLKPSTRSVNCRSKGLD